MRPPGGVSFADQMHQNRHINSHNNQKQQQHEVGRQFVHQQQPKGGRVANGNGFGGNNYPPVLGGYGKSANESGEFGNGGHLQSNGRGHREEVVVAAHHNHYPQNQQQQQLCECCPYGFHIDLGFVKFAEDVAAGKEQIQNWSSPAKKRARHLLNSPSSSERTMLDVSATTDRGGGTNANNDNNNNGISPPLNESSLSKSVDEDDELPELVQHGFCRAKSEQHRRHQQQQHTPGQLFNNNHLHQQHQSRFYQQQAGAGGNRMAISCSSSAPSPPIGRRRFSLSVASTTPVDAQSVPMPSLRFGGIGSPLRTSTPRIANEEIQQIFASQQQRPSSAHHYASTAFGGGRREFVPFEQQTIHQRKLAETENGSGTNSAPTSPVPPRNFHTAIAQSVAQLRKTSSTANRTNGSISAMSVCHSSLLSTLSAPARHVFSSASNVAMPTLPPHYRQPTTQRPRPYLELGGGQCRRMLSPEPHQMPAALEPPAASCSLLRRSNLQSRSFFHAANNNGGTSARLAATAGAGGGRVPYRSRLCATPTPSSAWDLGDFASVRRHRMDSYGGTVPSSSTPTPSCVPVSAHFVRSLSPPQCVPTSASFSHHKTPKNYAVHSAPSPPSNAVNGFQRQEHPFLMKAFANNIRNIGTQTIHGPTKKEVAIGTDQPKSPPKRRFKEMGTSPEGAFPPTVPLSVAVPSVSIGVDTRDLLMDFKNAPPPPPKPSGPELDVELQRRRHIEERRAKLCNLSAEFQYCLGHEPEHRPGDQPQFMGTQRAQNGSSTNAGEGSSSTIDRGVDALRPTEENAAAIRTHSLSTSTSDLVEEKKKTMADAKVQTTRTAQSEKGIGTEPKGSSRTTEVQTEETTKEAAEEDEEERRRRTNNAEEAKGLRKSLAQIGTQTDESEWLEAEVGRRLAEATAERREKRKRNSVERSTETEEKEAPDQFIMITCNKCEQRSSVANDELFEKIVVPVEDNADDGEDDDDTNNARPEHTQNADGAEQGQQQRHDALGEELLPDFFIEENVRGEMETILEELEEEEEDGTKGATAPMDGHGAKVGHTDEERTDAVGDQQQHRRCVTPQKWQQLKQQQQPPLPSQNVSPLSSDEGLVLLANGEEEKQEEEAEKVALLEETANEQNPPIDDADDDDRISIETDVQTVICADGTNAQSDFCLSFESADEKPTNSAASFVAASRTDALRKLLTEPQRFAQPFQRDAGSYRSYRTEKGKANDLEYIIERHKSDTLREAEPTTPCPSFADGGRKALTEAITLKKTAPLHAPATSTQTLFNISHIPEPVPARIPRPKIAKYSPNAEQAETADEQAEASDRLTPLRSEMRVLASSLWGTNSASVSPSSSACGSPRVGRALIVRPQLNEHQIDDDEKDTDSSEGRRAKYGAEARDSTTQSTALVDMEDASSTSSEGARTYEMSDEDGVEFELSAPLRDALETIDGHLTRDANAAARDDDEPHNSAETEWAYKYCQHEWMKLTVKKSANAELVEQFIDALETFSNRLMEKVVNLTDQNGNSALHYAVSNENFDVVSVLLDSKVCRVDEMNKAGYSALMLGALCELRNETECAIMQRLFQMGNVNAKALKHSQTALMLAASHGRVETTSLLLACGADMNIQDVDGSTALMCAAEHGQREIVKILLKRPNIDASLTDCDNQTALSIAVENQHRDIGVLIYAHLNFSRLESNDQSGVSI